MVLLFNILKQDTLAKLW